MAISGWGIFLIILFVLIIGAVGGYIFYAHYRARKLGLPPPNLNPFNKRSSDRSYGSGSSSNIFDSISSKFNSWRNGRTAGGAYESTGYGANRNVSGGRREFGALDPDGAWNARIDEEAGGYYEEQELGLQEPGHGPYGGGGYGNVGAGGLDEGRGRSRSRSRDARSNPFGDQAEASNMSLRSVSPRPDGPSSSNAQRPGHARGASNLSAEESPTERRSMFKEEM